MRLCDLHTHSVFSDGTYTPAEIIDAAINANLSAVALCDHNTADGLYDFIEASRGKNIEAIAGAEFSVDYNGTELHLLGLFIPEKSFPDISNLMSEVNDKKEKSNISLISSLNNSGYCIDFDKIKNSTPNGKFNRAHVAAELTRLGYTKSIKEAFDTLLSPKSGHYREPERLNVFDMIRFIRSIGALPVLAHPFLNLSETELEIMLAAAVKEGLAAMECYYSLFDDETTEKAKKLCDRFGLLYSGGSDFHGENKPDIHLGTGKGNLAIPYELVLSLKKAK